MARKDSRDAKFGVRDRLALWTLVLGAIGITSISIAVIAISKDHASAARLVFTAVLPLLGSWVGTVLAFYFARENLLAATESTLRITRRLDPGTPVREVMIPRSGIDAHQLNATEKAEDVELKKLYDLMQKKKRQRIPILSGSDAVLYVVHESTLRAFANSLTPAVSDLSTLTQKLADLRGKAECKKAVEAIGFVAADAVLADARDEMARVEGCNDVFVTETGAKSEPIRGWLTNTDLASVS